MEDMEIKVEDSFIFEGATIDTLIDDISEMPVADFIASRHVHQLLKDKILVYSNYLELYFYVGNCLIMKVCNQKKGTLETFFIYLEKLMKFFDAETILPPSLFYSELVTKVWSYFIRMYVLVDLGLKSLLMKKIMMTFRRMLCRYSIFWQSIVMIY